MNQSNRVATKVTQVEQEKERDIKLYFLYLIFATIPEYKKQEDWEKCIFSTLSCAFAAIKIEKALSPQNFRIGIKTLLL